MSVERLHKYTFMHGVYMCFDDVSDILIVGADTGWCACAQITLFQ